MVPSESDLVVLDLDPASVRGIEVLRSKSVHSVCRIFYQDRTFIGPTGVPVAITREISPSIERCELTHLDRGPIDLRVAISQHRRYERCLADLQCDIHRLPADPDLPDSVFVEDTAIVLDELAIIARPGAASRRPETGSMASVLSVYRELFHIEAPGTLDGGDVLVVDRNVYVGLSLRTNSSGMEQVRRLLGPHDYRVVPLEIRGCLHLKSAATQIAPDGLLVNRSWLGSAMFSDLRVVDVDPEEPFAANALLVGETLVYPEAFKRTLRRLQDVGITVKTVDVSELAKAEGGVTCCSLIFEP
jgi:dimethylargininase